MYQLTSVQFYKDQAGVMDLIEFGGDVAARNSGLIKRRSVVRQSRVRYDGPSACRHLLPGSPETSVSTLTVP